MAIAGAATAQSSWDRPRDSAAESIDFSSDKPLDELPLKLPAAPKPDALIAFDPQRPTTMKFFVDPASVTVGTDGIVRYTLVARGEGAAMNVSYEGIRCKTRERKTFAYGRADGSWYQPRDPHWAKIGGSSATGPSFALYEDFFCPARGIVATAVEAVEALRMGGHPRAEDLVTGRSIRR
jgi:hypothetical protein